jgi:hypothetical protein
MLNGAAISPSAGSKVQVTSLKTPFSGIFGLTAILLEHSLAKMSEIPRNSRCDICFVRLVASILRVNMPSPVFTNLYGSDCTGAHRSIDKNHKFLVETFLSHNRKDKNRR